MRKLRGVPAAMLAMGLPVVLALAFIVLFRIAGMAQSVPGAVPPSATRCAPTPVLWVTSHPSTPLHIDIGPVTRVPSVTPLPINKTTDLAPNVPESDKGQLIVMHCDGALELFWYLTPIATEPGDVIISQSPAVSGLDHPVYAGGTPLVLPTTTGPIPSMSAPTAPMPAGPVTGYPAPAQTQAGYPAPSATPVGVGSPYPTPTDVPAVTPTPALPPLNDSPDQFAPTTYGLPDTIAGFKVLAVITSKNQACVYPSNEKQILLQASAPTVQDYLKNTHATEIRQALDGLGLKPDEWTWSIVGPGSTREQIVAGIQAWNKEMEKYGCVQSVPPPTISPNSTP